MLLVYRRYIIKHPALRLVPRRVRRRVFLLRALAGKCYRVLVDPRLARLALLAVGEAIRQRIWPPISRKVMALAEARAVGGSIPLEELERLWDGLESCERALCLADGLDLRQLEIVLRARKVRVLLPGAESPEQDRGTRTMHPADLVIEVGDTGPGLDDR